MSVFEDLQLSIGDTCSDILHWDGEFGQSDSDPTPWASTVMYYIQHLILHCKPEAATRVSESLFQVPDFHANLTETRAPLSWLEVFWNYFPGRPDNLPSPQWDQQHLLEASRPFDPENVEFYGEWTNTAWIERTREVSIGQDYNTHQWKGSQDVWTYALCARVMCRPKDGKAPSRETLQEAFEAVEKLSTMTLPPRHDSIFPIYVHFVLAVHLGYLQRARELLQEVERIQDPTEYFCTPALYVLLMTSMDDPPFQKYDDDSTKYIQEELCTALNIRAEHGPQKSVERDMISKISMSELLKRFSEAAFFVYEKAYLEAGIMTPAKVLRPPLTVEHIAQIDRSMDGDLPPDLKEMALVADGFYGGWSFAGGGWGGIANLGLGSGFVHYSGYFGSEETYKVTRTKEDGSTEVKLELIIFPEDMGNLYVVEGAARCDGYEHVLCPPAVWKKMREMVGQEAKEGEYALTYSANWSDTTDLYPSMRDWLEELTVGLERSVAAGYQSGEDSEDTEEEEN
jgi:hypothetical protein